MTLPARCIVCHAVHAGLLAWGMRFRSVGPLWPIVAKVLVNSATTPENLPTRQHAFLQGCMGLENTARCSRHSFSF
jgi:hypothetical protein